MTQFGNGSRSCFYFLFAVVHSTTPLTAAKFLYFHRLPCSRCLCRHAELLNSLLVALKICCFVQVELSRLVLPECMLVLACAEEDVELPGLLFSPVWLHSCLSSLPPPGSVREEPHCFHLCNCIVRKCFYVLWKKRQLNIF